MIGAFQRNAFQDNAYQVAGAATRGGVGGIYWKPEKDYEWPDLPGDVLSSVLAAVREISGASDVAPTVEAVIALVQPEQFAMPVLSLSLEELAARLREAAAMAIDQWMEDDDEEAILALLH